MTRRCTTEEFIDKANLVHCNKYTYDLVEYKGNKVKVTITCPIHGNFLQAPSDHLSGKGCMECSGKKRKTTNEFIEAARSVHGDFYDYSKVEYKNGHSKVCIICPEHGEFMQTPNSHISGNQGCSECGKLRSSESRKLSHIQYMEKVIERYGDSYDYTRLVYSGSEKDITIGCTKHGYFVRKAKLFLYGHTCTLCGYDSISESRKLTNEQFIDRCKDIYGNSLIFEHTEYVGISSLVSFTCPIHGNRKAKASALLYDKSGCTLCSDHGGYKRDKVGYFYINYIFHKNPENNCIKFGVTNNYKHRLYHFHKKNSNLVEDTMCLFITEGTGYDVWDMELFIKRSLKSELGFLSKDELPDGHSETISTNNLNYLQDLVTQYLTIKS